MVQVIGSCHLSVEEVVVHFAGFNRHSFAESCSEGSSVNNLIWRFAESSTLCSNRDMPVVDGKCKKFQRWNAKLISKSRTLKPQFLLLIDLSR